MLGLLQEPHFQDHSVGGKDELLILVDKYLENFIIEINNFFDFRKMFGIYLYFQ